MKASQLKLMASRMSKVIVGAVGSFEGIGHRHELDG